MTEVWKNIKGYEGRYQISSLGKVKSLKRQVKFGRSKRFVEEAILNPTDNGQGYKIVGLRKDGKRKNFYVHRLVAETFIPNTLGLEYVNHIDFNKSNNCINNLEWCTQKDNVNYSKEHMRKPHNTSITTNTGHKYIRWRNGKYRVYVPHYSERCFDTIEKALEYRGDLINGR